MENFSDVDRLILLIGVCGGVVVFYLGMIVGKLGGIIDAIYNTKQP